MLVKTESLLAHFLKSRKICTWLHLKEHSFIHMWLASLVYNCFILYALQASLVGVSTLVNYNERHVDKVI